jgi:hypothetical protein
VLPAYETAATPTVASARREARARMPALRAARLYERRKASAIESPR